MLKSIIYYIFRFSKTYISLNHVFFGKSIKNYGDYIILKKTLPPSISFNEKFEAIIYEKFNDCAQGYLCHNELLREYILNIEDCIIEPEYGWGISINSKLIKDSIPYNEWLENYKPSFLGYIKNKNNSIFLDTAIRINLVKGGDKNYWHILHDIIGQVYLAKQHKLDELPFIISSDLYKQKIFQFLITNNLYLKNLNWVVQDKNYYNVKNIFFIQKKINSSEQLTWIRETTNFEKTTNLNRSIFLTRSNKRKRFLSNSLEIEMIAKKIGFEIVDSDDLSINEQLSLFYSCKNIIGLHGAGLTNIIFSKSKLTLLEIFPINYIQPHYYWLCKDFNYNYNAITGDKTNTKSSFYLNPIHFEKKVKETFNFD
jgi:hypothetical protein